MELLANVWGTEESLEGMQAFLDKRPADFNKFRGRNREALDRYTDDFDHDRNQSARSRSARP
jgi:naphthoate synthase